MLRSFVGPREHPGAGAVLDRSHSLVRSLRFYTAFQELLKGAPAFAGAQGFYRALYRDQIGGHQFSGAFPNVPTVGDFVSRTGPGLRWQGFNGSAFGLGRVGLLETMPGAFTVGVKVRGEANNNAVVTKSSGNHIADHFDLRIGGTGGIAWTVGVAGGSLSSTTSGYLNTWITAFGIWTTGQMRIVIVGENGELLDVTDGAQLTGPVANTTLSMSIAQLNTAFTTMTGSVEWVGVWADALSTQDCAQLGGDPYQVYAPRLRFWRGVLSAPPTPPDAIVPVIVRRRETWLPPSKPRRTDLLPDWQNPLTQGLLFAMPFTEGQGIPGEYASQVTFEHGGSNNNKEWNSSNGLLGFRFRSTIRFFQTTGVDGTQFILPRNRCTALLITSGITTGGQPFGADTGVSGPTALLASLSTGNALFSFGSHTLTWTGYRPLPSPEVWAFRAGPRGSAMWLNGVRVASQTTSVNPREETPGKQFFINGGTGGGIIGTIHLFALIDAEWEDGQVLSWMRDPWQLFTSSGTRFKRQVFSVPAPTSQGIGAVQAVRAPQPVQSTGGINWRHPLAQGLRMYLSLNQWMRDARPTMFYDRVTNTPFQSFTPGVTDGPPSRTGKTMALNGSSSGKINTIATGVANQPATLLNWRPTEPVTFAAKFAGGVNGAGTNEVVSISRSLTCDMGIQVVSGPAIQFIVLDSAASAARTQDRSEYGDNQTFHTVFARVAGAGIGAFIELYVFDENGILIESATGAGALASYPGLVGATSIMGFGTGGNGLGAFSKAEWWGIWKRYMPTSDMAQLAQNPYQIFRDPARERWRSVLKVVTGTPGTISPTGIASAEAFGTAIVQGAILPTAIASAEALGTAAVIDVATTISPVAIASAEAHGTGEVFGDAGAAGTIDLSGFGIVTAEVFGTATVQEDATISPTGIASAFDMDLHDVGAGVATIAPQGIPSEEAFSQVSTGGGINGGTTVVTPTNPNAPAAGTITTKKLCSPLALIRAEVFNDALDGALILPDVYGDFSAGGLRGPVPAVLVNSTSPFTYVAAAHPVAAITNVYVDDVEQTSGFATVSAVDLGAGFQVAVIAFSEQPLGQVTWRGQGKRDTDGNLLTDPILILEDVLMLRGGYAPSDFDPTTLAAAKAASAAAAWSQAWVFQDDRQAQEWITEVLFNVMGFWRVSGKAQLQLMVDPGGTPLEQDLVASIVANRDVVDGDDGVKFVADRQQLVNRLVAAYRWSWSESRYAEQLGGLTTETAGMEDFISSNAYGELRKEVTLRGHRDPDQVVQWAAILFERQAFETRVEGGLVFFKIHGPQLIHATVGDVIAFTWPYGPTRELGNPYTNQILRITQINHDFTQGGVSDVTAVDTGAFVNVGGVRVLDPLPL